MCVFVPQRMQLDIILTSLQDHTHVASLLGYSSPADGPEVLPSGPAFTATPDPTYSATAGHPDTHLAEILMKTLLRNLGFYTVSRCRMMFGIGEQRVCAHWFQCVCVCVFLHNKPLFVGSLWSIENQQRQTWLRKEVISEVNKLSTVVTLRRLSISPAPLGIWVLEAEHDSYNPLLLSPAAFFPGTAVPRSLKTASYWFKHTRRLFKVCVCVIMQVWAMNDD